jgi:hypothetical protein
MTDTIHKTPITHMPDVHAVPKILVCEFLAGRWGGRLSKAKSVTPGGTLNSGSSEIGRLLLEEVCRQLIH